MTHETITDEETNRLLKEAAMRDQRTIGATDIAAWYTDLNVARIGYADALAAVSRYYSIHWPKQPPGQRFRLTAPVLIELVREIREERHVAADYLYEPVGGETGHQYVARLRSEQRAVGDGLPPAFSKAQLVERSDGVTAVAELVSGIAQHRQLPEEVAEVLKRARPSGIDVACPRCRAVPGRKCTDPATGRRLGILHGSRIDSWAILTAACPECRAAIGEGCRELGQPYRGGAHHVRVEAAQRTREHESAA